MNIIRNKIQSIIVPRLDVITGPMFAGKTSRILWELNRANDVFGGISVYVGFEGSERNGDIASTHSKSIKKIDNTISLALSTLDKTKFLDTLKSVIVPESMPIVAIGFDESQFFDGGELYDLVHFLVMGISEYITRDIKRPRLVIVGGLSGDYRAIDFKTSGISKLIPISDSFIKLTSAACVECIKDTGVVVPASFTDRSDTCNSLDTILIGGSDKYVSVCRYHFLKKFITN